MKVRSWAKKRFLKELGVVYPRLGNGCGRGVMMDWAGNKWTKGSYSFPKPGRSNEGWAAIAFRLFGARSFCGRAHLLRVYGIHGSGAAIGDSSGGANCKTGRTPWKKAAQVIPAASERHCGRPIGQSHLLAHSLIREHSLGLV